ncbi:hypothetical protein [Cuneatibacter caecimuris]|uniref:Uncharacterized protein n=1 Tax=Cuneatibacter caecimuris TaxID=1796618 RepID=A0A4Q7P3U6_9FIRM|nr:hypothetical protein [Cuneatibacter caecimuris]RZS94080.1 hypothetical protein EV209_2446 [Cuneatibacter caecimuris]
MTRQEFEIRVWPYYLRLEREFIETLNYVEFSEDNFLTYSIEYEKQLLSICSEIDMLCKELCKEIDADKELRHIYQYAEILCDYQNISEIKIIFEINQKKYIPFDGWTVSDSPKWWKAYNKVKHDRLKNNNFKSGNLENVFMALAGLYLLNRIYFRQIKNCGLEIGPNPPSQIFSVDEWNICIHVGNGFYYVLIPDGSMSFTHE